MSTGTVHTSIQNGIASIVFFHPQSNSLPGTLLQLLASEIVKAGNNSAVRVIVLKSEGEKAFCAGASFDELVAIDSLEKGQIFFSGFAAVINAIRKVPKFVIARVQGKAVGGGVAVIGQRGELGVDGQFGEGGLARGPEGIEAGGILLGGFDVFRLKGGGCKCAVGFPVLLDRGDAAEKAGLVHGAAFDGDAIGGERRGLIDFRRHHLGTDAVGHLDAVQRVAILDGDDTEADRLSGFIAPIGPVGRDAKLHGTDAVLGEQREGKEREDEESKHGLT